MCTGGTYAFVAEYTAASGSKKGMDLKSFAPKRLITSPPLVAYVVMFILAVANIDTPPVILALDRANGKGQHICCHADVRSASVPYRIQERIHG